MLADRVGIIDHGRIVAEGTPEALKAEIGRPSSRRSRPGHGELRAHERGARPLRRAVPGSPKGARVRLAGGDAQLADVVRALDAEDIVSSTSSCTRRRSTTSSSPRPAARSRARRGATPRPRARARAGGGVSAGPACSRSRSVVRTLRQPAMVVPSLVFPLLLLSINASGLDSATRLPGLPDRLATSSSRSRSRSSRARCSPPTAPAPTWRATSRRGFLNRLSLTPLRRVALMLGQLAGILALGLIQALTFVVVGLAFGAGIAAGLGGVRRDGGAVARDLARLRLHRCVRGAAHRLRRGGAGRVPALLRRAVPVVDGAAARPDRERLVPHDRRPGTRSPTCSRRSARW